MTKGRLMGSEDPEGDFSENKMETLERENPKGDQEEGRMELNVQANQMRGPEGVCDEIDPIEKRGESETVATR